MVLGKQNIHMQNNEDLTSWRKINSEWIKDLNARLDKTLRGKQGWSFMTLNQQWFLRYGTKCISISNKVKIDKWDYINLKTSVQQTTQWTELKRPPTGW